MFTIQSRRAAAGGGTARMIFGPFKSGEVVIGFHCFGTLPAGTTGVELGVAVLTEFRNSLSAAEFAALEQLIGPDSNNDPIVTFPPNTAVFVPLDLQLDRNAWIALQVTNNDAAIDLDLAAGVERALDQLSQRA